MLKKLEIKEFLSKTFPFSPLNFFLQFKTHKHREKMGLMENRIEILFLLLLLLLL
jgi:hypothetical protein